MLLNIINALDLFHKKILCFLCSVWGKWLLIVPWPGFLLLGLWPRNIRLKFKLGYLTRINQIVDEVIAIIGLEGVQNSIIGDVNKRGISGGEKKRVNIVIELVTAPAALFLDEPTSRLDSTRYQRSFLIFISARDVVQYLRQIASMGITVVMILHQPE